MTGVSDDSIQIRIGRVSVLFFYESTAIAGTWCDGCTSPAWAARGGDAARLLSTVCHRHGSLDRRQIS